MENESRVEVVPPTHSETADSAAGSDPVQMMRAFVQGSEVNAQTKAESYLTTVLQREIGLIQQSISQLLTLQQTDTARRDEHNSRWFEIRSDVHRLSDSIHSIERSIGDRENAPQLIKSYIQYMEEELRASGTMVSRGLGTIEQLVRQGQDELLRLERDTSRRQQDDYRNVTSQLSVIENTIRNLGSIEELIRSQGGKIAELNSSQREAMIGEFFQMREQLRSLSEAIDDLTSLDALVRSQGEELIRHLVSSSQQTHSQLVTIHSQLTALEGVVKELPFERLLSESKSELLANLLDQSKVGEAHYSELRQDLTTLQEISREVVASQGRFYTQAYHATKARLDQMERGTESGFQGVVLKLEQVGREQNARLNKVHEAVTQFSNAVAAIHSGFESLKFELRQVSDEQRGYLSNALSTLEAALDKNTAPLLNELSAVSKTLTHNHERFERQTAQAFAQLSSLVIQQDEQAKAREQALADRLTAIEPQLNWMADINSKMVKAVNQIASKLNFISAAEEKKEKRNMLIAGGATASLIALLLMNLMVSYYFR